jgi:hypothetical protein
MLTLLLLAGLCMIALCSELAGCVQAAQPEKPLRAEPPIPKVKDVQAEPVLPPLPEPVPSNPKAEAPVAPPLLEPPAIPGPAVPPAKEEPPLVPIPVVPEPPQIKLPQPTAPSPPVASVEVCSDPLVHLRPTTPQPLESPMLRTWKTLALYSLLAAAAQAPAQSPGLTTKDLEGINKRLDQLEQKDLGRGEQIEDLRKALQTSPKFTQADLDKMNKRLDQIEDIRKTLQRLDLVDAVQKDVVALSARLANLEERKAAPAASGNDEVRENLKKIEEMLNKVLDMQADLNSVKKDMSLLKKDVKNLAGDQIDARLRIESLELKFTQLAEDLKSTQKRLDSGTTSGASPVPGLQQALDEIRSKLTSIEQGVQRLQTTPPTRSQGAEYPRPASGRVTLENLYGEDLLFIVNGRMTRVPAYQTMTLSDITPGQVTYEVMSPTHGAQPVRVSRVEPNGTLRITARETR